MKKKIKKILKRNSGFTLIEALVAISILMIAIASPMALAQQGLSSATLSKDQMIAAFLAQDGIESVKNIRDQISARGITTGNTDWLNNPLLSPCICTDNSSCNFDLPQNPASQTLMFCNIDPTLSAWDATDPYPAIQTGKLTLDNKLKMSYDGNSNFVKYDYDKAGTDSIFTRYINIEETPMIDGKGNHNEAIVNVRVFWNSPRGIQKIDLQDFIYNYSENF